MLSSLHVDIKILILFYYTTFFQKNKDLFRIFFRFCGKNIFADKNHLPARSVSGAGGQRKLSMTARLSCRLYGQTEKRENLWR
jgi:hypothetical protein